MTIQGDQFFVDSTRIDERAIRIFTQPEDLVNPGPHYVTVTAILKTPNSQSCSGFQLIPIDALGTEYFTLTWQAVNGVAPRQTIAVSSYLSNTVITLNFPPGVSLRYNGFTYNEGTPLQLTLNRWNTFYVIGQNGQDLSGMMVRSNNRVAVTTGVVSMRIGVGEEDTLHEQMVPVNTYGTTHVAVPFDENPYS